MEERKVKENEATQEHESETIMDKDRSPKLTESLLIMLIHNSKSFTRLQGN